jgi:cytidine deaminase
MDVKYSELSEETQYLLDYAENKILKFSQKRRDSGLNDSLYAFVRSESGNMYMGKPFECNHQSQFNICAERHAMNSMQLNETVESSVGQVLVASPVPEGSNKVATPCGACRHALWEFGNEDTVVLACGYVREDEGWEIFSEIKMFTVDELYPNAYENPWD